MVEEVGHRLILVFAQREAVAVVEFDFVGCAGGVSGEVFCRPSEFQQLLFELAASPRLDHETGVATPLEQEIADLLRAGDLGEHGTVTGGESEHPIGVSFDDQPAVASDRFADVDGDTLGNRKLGVFLERFDHLLGAVAGGAGVPEPESGDAVGVHVLGGSLEFGENGEIVSGVFGKRMPDFEKHGAIALHDHRSGNRVRQPGHG